MIETYARLLARCATPNQVNRVHITLSDRMSPSEFDELRRGMPPRAGGLATRLSAALRPAAPIAVALRRRGRDAAPPSASHEWVDGMAGWMDRSGKCAPEPFVRRRVRPQVDRYSDGRPSASKTLAICFTGAAGRLFVPIPVYLQHLRAERFDVLVLRDRTRRCYRAGLPGVAPDFEGLVEQVGRMFDRRAYRSVVSYGTSGGGLPALVTALRLGLDKGVSVGGRDPSDPRWLAVAPGGPAELLRAGAAAGGRPTRLMLVYGADSDRDRESAQALARLVPVAESVVRGAPGEKVGHNPVFPLLLGGRLRESLEDALST